MLMRASEKNHHKVVDLLLKKPNIDVDATTDNNQTAMMIAAKAGNKDILKRLLSASAVDINEALILVSISSGLLDANLFKMATKRI